VRILGRFIACIQVPGPKFLVRSFSAQSSKLNDHTFSFELSAIGSSELRNGSPVRISLAFVEVFKCRKFIQKSQVDLANGTVPLFPYDHLCLTPIRIIF